jgi:hypothetical protein
MECRAATVTEPHSLALHGQLPLSPMAQNGIIKLRGVRSAIGIIPYPLDYRMYNPLEFLRVSSRTEASGH